jgi:hypothetical protein
MDAGERTSITRQKSVAEGRTATSALSQVVKYLETLIFDRPLWHLAVGILLVDLVKNGIERVPEISDWARMAGSFPAGPTVNQGDSFILSSPAGPAVAHLFGIGSSSGYAAFSFVATCFAIAILMLGLYKAGGRAAAGIGLVALFASPLSNTLLTWLGKEDPFLLLFTALVVLFDSPALTCLGGLGLATANPEAGAVIIAISVALRVVSSRSGMITLASSVLGFAAGCGLVAAYDAHIGAAIGGRFTFVQRTGARELIREFVSELPTWIFSVLGAYWICVVQLWSRVVRRQERLVVLLSALVCLSVTIASADQSRIAALTSLPLVLWFVVRSAREVDGEAVRTSTSLALLLAIVLPRVVVQAGGTYVSHVGAVLPSWL